MRRGVRDRVVCDAHLLEASYRAATSSPSSGRSSPLDLDTLVKMVLVRLRASGKDPLATVQEIADAGQLSASSPADREALAGQVFVAATCESTREWGHVRNDLSGVVHVVPRCEGPLSSAAITACGWRVGSW